MSLRARKLDIDYTRRPYYGGPGLRPIYIELQDGFFHLYELEEKVPIREEQFIHVRRFTPDEVGLQALQTWLRLRGHRSIRHSATVDFPEDGGLDADFDAVGWVRQAVEWEYETPFPPKPLQRD